MLYRFGLRSANFLNASLVTTAAMLAICLLTLAETTNTAEAAFPDENGKIAFTGITLRAAETTNNWEIYTVNPDGSELAKITNNPAIDMNPAWSPDGTKIAFVRNDAMVSASGLNNEEIYVMNADGTEQRRLTDDTGDDSDPAWSPDGTKIAFVSNREQSIDIFIMDADGGNVRRLTDNGRYNSNPSWSPDGTKIAFDTTTSSNTNESWETHTINVDGTGEKALTNDTSVAEWSPDGRRMVVQGSSGVEIMNADGTERRLLYPPGGTTFAWSPDGKKIALITTVGADDEIATINPDGSGQTSITRTPNLSLGEPSWQPVSKLTEAKPEKQQEQRQQNQQQQGSKNRSETVHPPDTGGPSLLLVASALLFSGGVLFYAGLKRTM